MAISTERLQQYFIAYYGRPGNNEGMQYWQAQNFSSEADLVWNFGNALQPEFQGLYGATATSPSLFINAVFQNLFGRQAEQEGLNYWLGEYNRYIAQGLDADTVRGRMVTWIMDGAQDGAGGNDLTALNNKTQLAVDYTNALDTSAEILAYEGNLEAGRTFLSTVNSATDVATVDVDAAVAAMVEGSGTGTAGFTLTNGTDVATANIFNAGLVYTPGGDDRINALQDEDILTGTGENPTLNATLGNANDNGATVITPKLNGIETVNVAFTGSGGAAVTALDLQDSTGLGAVNVTRVSQAVNFAEVGNIQDPVAALSLSNTNSNQAGVVEFSYSDGVLEGENTGTLAVSSVQVGALNIGENTSFINAAGVGNNGFENLTMTSTGSNNVIGTLNLPMDTGTAGVLTIEGSGNLRIGGRGNIVNNPNNALVEAANVYFAGTGIAQAGGRIATIDASGYEGNLTLVLDNILDVGKAGTSGVQQDVTVTGGAGNDTFVLFDAIQAADSINGGAGEDTLLFYNGSSIASNATGIENATMQLDAYDDGLAAAVAVQSAVDFDFLPDATGMHVRNISNDATGVDENAAGGTATFTMYDLTAAQAAAIGIQHSTTLNGAIGDTVIEAAIKANTANDTVGITITDGTNVDPRFNFTLDTAVANTATSTTASASTFENVTLTDSDTESNSIELQNFAQHTGTITLTGGEAGDFINLDVDTAGVDVTNVTTGVELALDDTDGDGTPDVQQGLLGLNTDGGDEDLAAGNIIDVGALATQVRLGAAVINAAGEASDVIVRVGTNAASATGAQAITMGTGNDTVIFDLLNDARAGLTISDSVNGGEGNDTLVIDGNGVRITLGASEWTNVSNFENLRVVGNATAALGTIVGQNSYNLTLTNDLIQANGNGMLNIINDNDINNDTAAVEGSAVGQNTAPTGAESGITLDARTLNAQNHFTYNGEEGSWVDGNANGLYDAGEEVVGGTIDKFIFADANINGGNVIDGGAVDNSAVTFGANADIMEVRNTATVTVGDLAGISNVGIIAGTNDQALEQTLTLELNDTVVDALVDSYHTSTTLEAELLTIQMNAVTDITAPVGGAGLNLDASALTQRSQLAITLDATVPAGATDTLTIGRGLLTVNNFTTGTDKIVLDVSTLGLTLDADDVGFAIGTDTNGDGTNIETGVAAATAANTRIVIDDTGANLDIYYDVDGNGAQAQVLLASLVGVAAYAAGDFILQA